MTRSAVAAALAAVLVAPAAVLGAPPAVPGVPAAVLGVPAAPSPPRGAPAVRAATAPDLVALARRPGASATLLNVWATWCVPCRKEFPDLLRLERAYRARGLRLLLVSTDFDARAARRFLARQGVTFTTYLKSGGDQAFIDGLDRRWSGAQPATFVYDRAGRLVRFWEGQADYARFERAVRAAMGRATPTPEKTP